jgi:hypothetical protein
VKISRRRSWIPGESVNGKGYSADTDTPFAWCTLRVLLRGAYLGGSSGASGGEAEEPFRAAVALAGRIAPCARHRAYSHSAPALLLPPLPQPLLLLLLLLALPVRPRTSASASKTVGSRKRDRTGDWMAGGGNRGEPGADGSG